MKSFDESVRERDFIEDVCDILANLWQLAEVYGAIRGAKEKEVYEHFKQLKSEIAKRLPKEGIRDDEPLSSNANETEIYNKQAHNNMVDGYNQALSEVRKALGIEK